MYSLVLEVRVYNLALEVRIYNLALEVRIYNLALEFRMYSLALELSRQAHYQLRHSTTCLRFGIIAHRAIIPNCLGIINK